MHNAPYSSVKKALEFTQITFCFLSDLALKTYDFRGHSFNKVYGKSDYWTVSQDTSGKGLLLLVLCSAVSIELG